MELGKLTFDESTDHPELLALPTRNAIAAQNLPGVLVAKIDSSLADTAAFCEAHAIGLDVSANCVIVEARRADKVWYAACLILATDKIDVNGVVRKHFDARKISFAPMEAAVRLTEMEYGGITPLGLPGDWPLLIDEAVVKKERVIIGSGIRGSKLLVEASLLALLPHAAVMDISKKE